MLRDVVFFPCFFIGLSGKYLFILSTNYLLLINFVTSFSPWLFLLRSSSRTFFGPLLLTFTICIVDFLDWRLEELNFFGVDKLTIVAVLFSFWLLWAAIVNFCA